ncbi:ATP synthase E chain-domain-containing protein [Jimgerdemannia flammicorona]|uniref:ATP synthase E chain-domain-containing protein n=2 Tax=Jimgerdemannia flammicorona TaxID=994334 RepID=A0A433QNR8_9FUNG|nr:ATP synthase E chain-domain-containing protein [Jimgerdemannia flammicorona]RUS31425.1 ATP synthase E chain-domain-containing protein [Jimgerdemannia flammicorona]
MTSPVRNVARWSALSFGLAYGFWHNKSLHNAVPEKQAKFEYDHKVDLINKAKAAYAKKKDAEQPGSVITDPENPAFDFEKFITYIEQQEKH